VEEKELADSLREIFTAVNQEIRMAGPATLERCLDRVFDGPGVDWLLNTAKAWNLADVDKLCQNARAYRDLLCSESGKEGLKAEMARKQEEVKQWRRQMVTCIRSCQGVKMPVEFESQGTVDANEIYGMLIRKG